MRQEELKITICNILCGLGLFLTLALSILKVSGVLMWGWFYILMPIWIPCGLYLFCSLFVFIVIFGLWKSISQFRD